MSAAQARTGFGRFAPEAGGGPGIDQLATARDVRQDLVG